MTDKKNLDAEKISDEKLSDEQLEKVAGGDGHGKRDEAPIPRNTEIKFFNQNSPDYSIGK